MTDKQIIIDGVDVSECCQYMHRHMEDYDIDTLDYCRHHFKPCKDVDVKYCYYKQLKRKEQECEELKHKVELMMDCTSCKIDEYKQTLTEIKEIMKKHCRKCKKHKFYHFKLCFTCKYTEIIQKISEVLDDRQKQ